METGAVKKELAIRSQIRAPKSYTLLSIDLSKAETWIVAYSALEPRMIQELKFGDIHSFTARGVFGVKDVKATKKNGGLSEDQYFIGKKSNHANSYRQSYLMYVMAVNRESDRPPFITLNNEEGKRHHDIWHQLFNLKNWWFEIEDKLKNDHYLINCYGRKRYFYDDLGDELWKKGTAYLPQSGVADHFYGKEQKENPIPGGLKQIYRKIIKPSKSGTSPIRCVNTSHDSILLEAPSSCYQSVAREAVSYLERPIIINGESFVIPAECEVGERWTESEKLKF